MEYVGVVHLQVPPPLHQKWHDVTWCHMQNRSKHGEVWFLYTPLHGNKESFTWIIPKTILWYSLFGLGLSGYIYIYVYLHSTSIFKTAITFLTYHGWCWSGFDTENIGKSSLPVLILLCIDVGHAHTQIESILGLPTPALVDVIKISQDLQRNAISPFQKIKKTQQQVLNIVFFFHINVCDIMY